MLARWLSASISIEKWEISAKKADGSVWSSLGPRRVNHASVSIGDFIYSFGGYCSGEDYRLSRPMDVHVLNTETMRWHQLTMKEKKYPNVPFQRYGEFEKHEMIFSSFIRRLIRRK